MSFPRRARDIRRTAAHVLIGTLTLPIGFLESAVTVPQVFAAEQQVVLSEIQPAGNGFVELLNTGSDTVHLHGWSVWSQSHGEIEELMGDLAPNERRTIETRKLDNRGDRVSLRSSASTIVHQLEYGETATATIVQPEHDQSISWVNGFGFVANTTPTPGSDNQIPATTGAVTGLGIAASSRNPAHAINAETDAAATIEATVPAGATNLTVLLIDQRGHAEATSIDVGTAGHVELTMNARSLADGPIALRAAVTTAGGATMPWTTGNQAMKDIDAPEKPTVITPSDDLTVPTNTTTITGTAEANTTVSVWNETQQLATVTSNGQFSLVTPLTAGKNALSIRATDWAGNASRAVTLPTITSTSTDANSVAAPEQLRARVLTESRVQLTWSMPDDAQAAVHHFAIYGDDRSGTVNFTHPLGETTGTERTFTTASLPKGAHRFAVRAVNAQGNQSLNTNTVTATVAGFQFEQSLRGGQELIDFRPNQPVVVHTSPHTTNRGRMSVESLGNTNPFRVTVPGASVGKYYELLSTNNTVFPLEIRIYYTALDVAAAGVTHERQLTGMRYFDTDSQTWQSFDQTGVNTTDVTVDGTAYAGYFYAVTTHLTTVVGVADVTDPGTPSRLTGEAGDRRVKLTWDTQAEAAGYWIRYRKATNIDTVPYTTAFLSGKEQTSYQVNNLANGTLYEFGVAAEDSAGNVSDFAVIEQTPTASAPTTDFVTPATARLTSSTGSTTTSVAATSGTGGTTTTQQPGTATPADEPSEPADDDGDVRGGTDSQDDTQSARSLVTLLIVLVAAAAGFGGYYGYQWWTARPEDFDEPEPIRTEEQPPKKTERTEKPEKGDRPGGRW